MIVLKIVALSLTIHQNPLSDIVFTVENGGEICYNMFVIFLTMY